MMLVFTFIYPFKKVFLAIPSARLRWPPGFQRVQICGYERRRGRKHQTPNRFPQSRLSHFRNRTPCMVCTLHKNIWHVSKIALLFSPGRFFAANELKAMMAHILLNYDVKLAGDARPKNFWFQGFSSPSTNAEVLFRKRSTWINRHIIPALFFLHASYCESQVGKFL